MLPSPFNSRLPAAWLIVFVAGLCSGGVAFRYAREAEYAEVCAATQRAATALDPRVLLALTEAGDAPANAPALRNARRVLQQLTAAQSGVDAVAILRVPAQGTPVTLAELGNLRATAPEPSAATAIRSDFAAPFARLGRREYPFCEKVGASVLSYGAIAPSHATPLGDAQEVLALRSEAARLRNRAAAAGSHAAVYVWLLFGIPLGILSFRRKQSRHEAMMQTLADAVQQSQSGIMITRPNGRIEFVNSGLCQQLEYTPAEMIGRFWGEFHELPAGGDLLASILPATRTGQSWEGEWVARKKSGQASSVRSVVTPVYRARGEHLGFIAVLQDTTVQQRQQRELREAKDQAEAGDRAKGEFLATMSHEVRTPVHGIVGFTTLLLETPLTIEQREYVQTIRTSAEALVQLTGDILDFSRGESGAIQLESMVCDLRATIEDALDIFAGAAGEKGLELLHSVDRDVPAQVVLDGGRVRQVLVNLIGNAIKFTPGGEVEVSLRVLSGKATSIAPFELGEPAGQMVAEFEDGSLTFEFSVRDTGIGIAPEDRPKLFQAFSQLDVSSVRKFGGAGLGLAICRNLVRLMSGDIWLTSERGHGSTFTFTVRGRAAAHSEISISPFVDLRGLRVGLVQLPPSLADEIGQMLANSGAQVRMETMADIGAPDVDLLIVDCERVDSEAAARALRAGWRPERMIGLVKVNLSSAARQALRPHFGRLLNKPVHHRALLDVLLRAHTKAA